MALCLSVISCNNSTSTQSGDADAPSPSDEPYRIIYEKSESKAATRLRKVLYNITGKTPECTTDINTAPAKNEILVGDTGRAESTEFIQALGDYEYGVRITASSEGTKIIVAGKKSGYGALAAELFLSEYLEKDPKSMTLLKKEDTIMENTEDKTNDSIAAAEKVKWTGSNVFVQNGGYARMCELPDGRIACVYTGGGYVRFCTSSDKGMTWSEPTNVIKLTQTPNGQSIALGNANMAVMKDGTFMLAFRAHTAGSGYSEFYTSIRYCTSSDNGVTWSEDTVVAENLHKGSEFTGFWEPHMLYIKDGIFAMYYASDCIGGTAEGYPFVRSMTYQHIIVHLYDESTGKFGAPMIASNGEAHNSRDGMPVVCELADGTYAMVIESSSMRGQYPFIIQILFSEDGISWSAPKTIWKPSKTGEYAGAPYIVLLDDGRIAVSFQATEGSGSTIGDSSVHNSAMNVIISKKAVGYADRDSISQADFDAMHFNPILTTQNHSYSIWPAMLAYDGKLYCIAECGINTTTTNRLSKGILFRIGEYK